MPFYATLDNTKLYYEISGQGKPVVFIHGWSCSSENFDAIIATMKSQYRCIAYDHRGHGASSMPTKGFTIKQLGADLKALIDYLALDDVILVGHSMGAATIFSYISQFGCDKLSKIVMLDMSPRLLNDDTWQAGLLAGAYTMSDYMSDMDLLSQDTTEFMWRFWKLALPEFEAIPEVMKPLIAPGLLGINNPHALACLWHGMMFYDYREDMKAITVPAAYFIPEIPLYPMATAEFIRDHASAPVDIVSFDACTHMFLVEKPAEVTDAIIHFLNK